MALILVKAEAQILTKAERLLSSLWYTALSFLKKPELKAVACLTLDFIDWEVFDTRVWWMALLRF